MYGPLPSHCPRHFMDLRQIVRNVSSQWLTLAAQLVISVLMTPFLVSRLGDVGYGIIALISGLMGYSGILYFGLGAAVVKFVAEHHAGGEDDALNDTTSTIFTVYLAFGVLCLALALALVVPLPTLFRIPAEHAWEARVMLVLTGVGLLAQFPGSVYGGVLMGLERFDLLNTYNFGLLLVRTALTVAALVWRPTVVWIGVITMASLIAEQAMAYYFAHRELPKLQLSIKRFRRDRLGHLLSFGTQSFLFTLSEKLINYTDEFVISQARGPGAVTVYVIPLRLVDYARDAIDKATLVLMPGVSAAARRGELDKLLSVWRFGNKAVMCLVAPATLVFLVWGQKILSVWLDPGMGTRGYPVLRWLALAFVAQVAGRGLARPIFEGLGELSIPARITIVEGLVNLVLSVILVRVWGIEGAAFGTFLPAAISGFFVMPIYVCRRLGVSYLSHALHTFVRTLPPLVPAYGVLHLAARNGLDSNLFTMALTCLVVLVVYIAGAFIVTLDSDERQTVLSRLRR